ncbi:hypothetical protein SAMN04489723_11957 [Algoriphagus aquimarinus]|uniref:Uncharacterized protein n=1 Tax=Algoriphagus aquimarinus TaxID=237018 RepID=A0A1I1BZN9_9BACT|nr:hypothetical protein SAMN04489723_11957 [Algoriphagus aquimarinus]
MELEVIWSDFAEQQLDDILNIISIMLVFRLPESF